MSTFTAADMARERRWWMTVSPTMKQTEDPMNAVLKRLNAEPHGAICLKAYLDHKNYCATALMSEQQVTDRILKTMSGNLKHSAVRDAIMKGFVAAKRNQSARKLSDNFSKTSENLANLVKYDRIYRDEN